MTFLKSAWLSVIYYICAAMLAGAVIVNAQAVSDGERAISELDSAEERTDRLVKQWMERLSFGLYTGASDKARIREQIEAAAGYHRARVNVLAWTLAGFSVGYLLLLWLCARGTPLPARERLLTHVHGVASVCLVVGLLAPMLTIIAQREMAVIGQVVLHFESKSILSTVGALAGGGNWFVAVLLAVFSVAVPAVKLLLSLAALAAPEGSFRRACLHLIALVGKWSMTDVFVVAVLLAFLALGDGALTDARLGPGLYFFAAYALLSLVGGFALTRRVTRYVV